MTSTTVETTVNRKLMLAGGGSVSLTTRHSGMSTLHVQSAPSRDQRETSSGSTTLNSEDLMALWKLIDAATNEHGP